MIYKGRRKGDSLCLSDLNPRKLLNLRFAQFAKLAQKTNFGCFDLQTRYSASPKNLQKNHTAMGAAASRFRCAPASTYKRRDWHHKLRAPPARESNDLAPRSR